MVEILGASRCFGADANQASAHGKSSFSPGELVGTISFTAQGQGQFRIFAPASFCSNKSRIWLQGLDLGPAVESLWRVPCV
jgi:hypothetical protein